MSPSKPFNRKRDKVAAGECTGALEILRRFLLALEGGALASPLVALGRPTEIMDHVCEERAECVVRRPIVQTVSLARVFLDCIRNIADFRPAVQQG